MPAAKKTASSQAKAAKPAPKPTTRKTVKAAPKPAAPAKPAAKPVVLAKPVKGAPLRTSRPASGPLSPSFGSTKIPSPIRPAPFKAEPGQPVEPVKMPAVDGGRTALALIEIVKDGHFFIGRTQTTMGPKEYKNTVFEDLLTEIVTTLQDQLPDH